MANMRSGKEIAYSPTNYGILFATPRGISYYDLEKKNTHELIFHTKDEEYKNIVATSNNFFYNKFKPKETIQNYFNENEIEIKGSVKCINIYKNKCLH
ncbi:hypothetical protein ACFL1H_08135 [Nanoarchaeota archaeon]